MTLVRMPVAGSKRLVLADGVPISSLGWMTPSTLASFQHEAFAVALHAPLFWLGPQVSVTVLRLFRLPARAIRESK